MSNSLVPNPLVPNPLVPNPLWTKSLQNKLEMHDEEKSQSVIDEYEQSNTVISIEDDTTETETEVENSTLGNKEEEEDDDNGFMSDSSEDSSSEKEAKHKQSCIDKIHSLCASISREEPLQKSLEYLIGRTFVGNNAQSGAPMHRACRVCVICDRFIKGTSCLKFVSKEKLLNHAHVLNVDFYNKCTNTMINRTLREQYKVDDECLEDLLLSPRSSKKEEGYMCCESCYCFVSKEKNNELNLPKEAISNGNAIGELPSNIRKGIVFLTSL